MPRCKILFRFIFCALLCLSALNIASWRIALSIHEVHDHGYCHPPLSSASDSWHKPGHHHVHGVCHICKLFSQHKPNGISKQISPPGPVFIISNLIPAFDTQTPSPIEHGDQIRAPPLA